MRTIATIAFTHSFIFLQVFITTPSTIATTMNNIDTVAAAAPLKFFVTAPSVPVVNPLNVDETIDVKAAITRSVKSQQNSEKNLLPALPMYFSITSPMDLPSFLTDAYREPKSCTAPKNTPPTSSQSKTGTHPNIAAMIGPCTGPAPAMDEN